jgi:hypothetical protein
VRWFYTAAAHRGPFNKNSMRLHLDHLCLMAACTFLLAMGSTSTCSREASCPCPCWLNG